MDDGSRVLGRERGEGGEAAAAAPPPRWTVAYWRRPLLLLVLCLGLMAAGVFIGIQAVRAPGQARAIASAPVCGEGPPPCLTVRQGRLIRRPSRRSAVPGDDWGIASYHHRETVSATRPASRMLREQEGRLVTGLWWHGDLVGFRLDGGHTVLGSQVGMPGLYLWGSMACWLIGFATAPGLALISARRRGWGWWAWIPLPVWSFPRSRMAHGVLGVVGVVLFGNALGWTAALWWDTWPAVAAAWAALPALTIVAVAVRAGDWIPRRPPC